MMQEWFNLVDAWVLGQKYVPALFPPTMELLELEPSGQSHLKSRV